MLLINTKVVSLHSDIVNYVAKNEENSIALDILFEFKVLIISFLYILVFV